MLRPEDLKKFVKSTKFYVESIEEEKTENTTNQKLTLAEAIERVKGSNVTDSGAEMFTSNVTEVYINGTAEDETSDFGRFMKEARVENGKIVYEGGMKLDVSKPNGRIVNGNFVITKPAKTWLTSIAFNRRGSKLVQDNRAALSTAIAGLFGAGPAAAPASAPSISAKTEEKLEPVETGKGG